MCRLSFIVPAFNEAQHIPVVVQNIRAHTPRDESFEIILVDNGSTDDSYSIASQIKGVTVLRSTGTVGAARNAGAQSARGDVFIFLDADVRLTESWTSAIHRVLESVKADPTIVSGSTVAIPDQPSLIEKVWFHPITARPRNYINSGHLIVSKTLFTRLEGFDATLITGEDSNFSERARALGGRIVNATELKVIHLGFPKTVSAFVRRELWHGQGDAGSLRTVLRSRIASTSIMFVAALLTGLTLSGLFANWVPIILALAVTFATALGFGLRRARGFGLQTLLMSAALYYLYFFARAAAVLVHPKAWRQSR